MTPVEEYRKATAPWVRCTWCGTLRPPSTLDESGACVDVKWCRGQVARSARRERLDKLLASGTARCSECPFDAESCSFECDVREALMAWPRDYPALQRVEGLEVKAEFEVRPDDVGDPFHGE